MGSASSQSPQAKVVFLTGDYCSGSTLMFTLFRNTGEFYCLYEPLHSLIRQYQIWPLTPYEHHFHVGSYFDELRDFRRIPDLFAPQWAVSELLLEAGDDHPALRRYLDYLIEEAGRRGSRVAIKENRLAFRLGWVRQNYPDARIVHIHRACESQWSSVVRRVQSHLGRDDVGQDDPGFAGFNIAAWCDDLALHFPELTADRSATGFERFSKLWARSMEYGRRHADLAVSFEELTSDFDQTWRRIATCVGSACPAEALAGLVVSPQRSASALARSSGPSALDRAVHRAGRRYADVRVALGAARRRRFGSRISS
jgi:hypothetical protein